MLTPDERTELESLAHRSRSAPALARRARLVLACAEGRVNTTVARRLRLSPTTVCKWRARFVADRVAGPFDEPRPGTPRRISDDDIEAVISRTLEPPARRHALELARHGEGDGVQSYMTISRVARL